MNCVTCSSTIKKNSLVQCSQCNGSLHKDCAIKEDNTIYCDNCYVIMSQEPKLKNEIVIPPVIRRSYIETYRSCPYKFYREVILGESPENNNIHAQIGIDLHDLFGKACLQRPDYNKENMLDEFRPIWNSYDAGRFTDFQQQTELRERAKQCIDKFYSIISTLPRTPYAIEEKLVFAIGDELPKISTTLDRVDLIDDELEITDWKTGKVMVGEKLSTDMQAPLYIYAAKSKYNRPVRKFRFIYLQNGKERIYHRINNSNQYVCSVKNRDYFIDTDVAIKQTQAIFGRILNGDFNIPQDVKKMYFTCRMCHLQQQQKCQGADVQSWYNVQKTGNW